MFLCQKMNHYNPKMFNSGEVRLIICPPPAGQDIHSHEYTSAIQFIRNSGVALKDITYKMVPFDLSKPTYEISGTEQELDDMFNKLGPSFIAQALRNTLHGKTDELHHFRCHAPELPEGVVEVKI